jgi:hypothetical protein
MLKDYTRYNQKAHCFISSNTLTLGFGNSVIPNNVTIIGGGAFNGCNNLTSINIPFGVTRIGDLSFWGCKNLKEVVISDSVSSIGNLCFWGCKNLHTIYVPDSVVHLGECAFQDCNRLTICCQAKVKPEGWQDNWNPMGCKVKWGTRN